MSAQEKFLEVYDQEHATTLRVLRAYPPDQVDLKPSEKSNSARSIMWTFVLERGLGQKVWNDELAKGVPPGSKPQGPPDNLAAIIDAYESSSKEWRALIAGASDAELHEKVHFFVAPKTLGEYTRLDWAWFLLHDEIHHRGQLSVYLRIAGGKLPSIYGPTADEPWI